MERDLAAFAVVCCLMLPPSCNRPCFTGCENTGLQPCHVLLSRPPMPRRCHSEVKVMAKFLCKYRPSFLACVQLLGDTSAAARFASAAKERRAAIQALMYDEGRGTHPRAARRHLPLRACAPKHLTSALVLGGSFLELLWNWPSLHSFGARFHISESLFTHR